MMNNYKYTCLRVIFLFIFINTFCGTDDQFIPPSPNVSSIMQYAETPVNKYTGVPNISIPFYTIDYQDLKIPINLNYHASGIKVSQEASWVGLGWSLSAGGVITQQIKGYNDLINGSNQGRLFKGTLPSGYSSDVATYLGYNSNSRSVSQDGEADIFTFSFLGYSGKFMLTQSGIPVLIEQGSGLKIAKLNTNNVYYETEWKIVTTEGIVFLFKDKDLSYRQWYTDIVYNEGANGALGHTPLTISAWHLSEIIFPNGNKIDYSYKQLSNATQSIPQHSHTNIQEFDVEFYSPGDMNTLIGFLDREFTYSLFIQPNSFTRSWTIIDTENVLEKIDWPLGAIIFNTSNRLDIGNEANTTSVKPQKLERVEVIPKNETNTVHTISFDYSYFNSNRESETDVEERLKWLRLKLEGITIDDADYTFDYYSQVNDQNSYLPRKDSPSTDYWGYFNNQTNINGSGDPILVPTINLSDEYLDLFGTPEALIDLEGYVSYSASRAIGELNLTGANKEPDFSSTLLGSLKKITYPTKGEALFNYELNDYAIQTTSEAYTENRTGGGLRIESIVTEASTRIFEYETDGDISSGRLNNKPLFHNVVYYEYLSSDGNLYQVLGLKRTSINLHTLLGQHSGVSIAYGKVTESTTDNAGNTSSVVSYFKNDPETQKYFEIQTQYNQYNGQLYKEIFKTNGVPIKVIDYYYHHRTSADQTIWNIGFNSFFIRYPQKCEWWSLLRKKETTYASDYSSTAITKNTNYTYGDNKIMKSKTVSTDEDTEYTHYTYPQDILVENPEVDINTLTYNCRRQYTYPSALYMAVRGCMSNLNPSVLCAVVDDDCTDAVFNSFEDYLKAGTADGFHEMVEYFPSNGIDVCDIANQDVIIEHLAKSEQEFVDQCIEDNYDSELSSIANSEAAEVIDSMIAYNMLGVPVETIVSVNGKIVDGTSTKFGLDDNKLVIPKNIYANSGSYGYPLNEYIPIHINSEGYFDRHTNFRSSPITYIDRTDQYGNILEYHNNSDQPVTIKWDNMHTKPVAIIKNSTHYSYAYQNFEQDAYWLPHIIRTSARAKTGKYSGYIPGKGGSHEVTMVGSYVWTSNTDERKFKFSSYMYCTTDEGWLGLAYSTPTQSSRIAQWIPCTSTNEWTLVEGFGTIPDDATTVWVVISNENGQGAIYVDDVRMYPSDAAMTNYTYEPLKGLSAVIDERGIVTTYEYDAFGRLKCTKDNEGNILKTYDYHYAP